jgi:anti-sigma regulatory factor (Ser/Thr protein kinase)
MTRTAGGDGSPGSDIRLQARAVAGEVAGMRHAVLAAASASGLSAAGQADVGLAVSEACSNVVMHAYEDAATPGLLFVETHLRAGEFVVVVSDEGTGLAPRTHSPGLGYGLALIARLTQRMEIGSNGFGGARVTMAFARAG